MRSRICPLAIAALALAALLGCARGPSGAFGELVTSRGISLRVTVRTVGGRELPSVDFDNQSGADFAITPLKCSAWYEKSGLQEITWTQEDRRGVSVAAHTQLTGFITVDLKPPPGDRLLKVRLEYGPGADETYTFVRK